MINNKKIKSTRTIRPKEGQNAEIIVKSKYIKENLPLPYVLYPDLYGTFIGFSENVDFKIEHKAKVYFCTCAEPAIDNYLDYVKKFPKTNYSNWLIKAPLSNHDFPDKISKESILHKGNPKKAIHFKKGICHKCNLSTPTVMAMNPMYGGKFKQYYNWYINQQYYQLGIWKDEHFNKAYCPDELITLVEKKVNKKALIKRFIESHNIESLQALNQQILKNTNETIKKNLAILEKHEKELYNITLRITNEIESYVRQEFGYRKVGEGWIGETMLYKIIQEIFTQEETIRHCRPKWLEGLELDIYLPNIKLAFEYQGQQHYKPVKIWGGIKALKKLQERDAKKKLICKKQKIRLITVDYTEPLTKEHICKMIK
ncbi:MAG: hypothetical protein K8R58_06115 [Bacteroidales bacterium]|nr:hypothetical protein [Bacteroidales bacterium]